MKGNYFDCVIAGAGSSGLTAAIYAARGGLRTAILEHNSKPASKLLLTGSGRCNLTNKKQGGSFYYCSDPAFVLNALERFSAEDAIAFFNSIGIITAERSGYYYPRSFQSSSVRDALLAEADRLGVKIFCDTGIRSIVKKNDIFFFDTKSSPFSSGCCILACGGKSYPKTGSDGSGFIYAKSFGHSVNPLLPSLVALTVKNNPLRAAAGVRCPVCASIFIEGEKAACDTGELQITDYGISGIVIFQISHAASAALYDGRSAQAVIDFIPEYSLDEALELIDAWAGLKGSPKTWQEIFGGLINSKLSGVICGMCHVSSGPVCSLPRRDRRQEALKIVRKLKALKLDITDTKGFHNAQTTAGGIPVNEIDPGTMQSKLTAGLFLAGEMIDADGICGGYNLQWAWTSGAIAGQSASLYINGKI